MKCVLPSVYPSELRKTGEHPMEIKIPALSQETRQERGTRRGQNDERVRDAGGIGSHPLKSAEGEAATFVITSRKIKSEGGPGSPKSPPCRKRRDKSGAPVEDQNDERVGDAGGVGSRPLKTAEGGAALFVITSRKIKSEGGPASPKSPPCRKRRDKSGAPVGGQK
jgi:hypothetical protein